MLIRCCSEEAGADMYKQRTNANSNCDHKSSSYGPAWRRGVALLMLGYTLFTVTAP